ncbi:arginase family protein [Salinifilum ghardaiensis]
MPSPADVPGERALAVFAGRAGDHNDRAMTGARVLGERASRRLGLQPAVLGTPRPALNADWGVELDAALPQLRELGAHLGQVLADGAVPVTVLNRCAAALATLPAVVRHRPDACVLWLDAHADLNTPGTTPSGYLGGLALSGPAGLWRSGLGAGLRLEDVVLAGVRDVDAGERPLLDASVRTVPPGAGFAERVAAAVEDRPVYVHLDCDVLEPGSVATDYSVPGGLRPADLRAMACALAGGEVIGVELAEFETGGPDDTAAAEALLDALAPLTGEVSAGGVPAS